MAESQQEKVTSPRISDEEKHQYVLNFIRLRSNGSVRLGRFFDNSLERYLEKSGFVPLRPGIDLSKYLDVSSNGRAYFEYLLTVVSETQKMPSDIVEKAFNQSYSIISSLTEYMEIDRPIMDLVDWDRVKLMEGRIQTIEAELRSLKFTLDQRHQEIVNNFRLILDWEKEAKVTLARAKEYFDGLIRRPQTGQGGTS